jgi:hypothetical protein
MGKNRTMFGGTYPDYTLIEDATSEAFGGRTTRAKDVFDVLVPDERHPAIIYGVSCKMKQNDSSCLKRGRVYVEYSNADSEFRRAVQKSGYTRDDLISKRAPADVCGRAVVGAAREWHYKAAEGHKGALASERLDIEQSIHFVLSYTWSMTKPSIFDYLLYVWPHLIPQAEFWSYGEASLRGYESQQDMDSDDPVYTYNYTSGGHLKWYPRANSATDVYGPFTLRQAPASTLAGVAKRYFPVEWPE